LAIRFRCLRATHQSEANSANVYDSLAEAYERGGRSDLAEPLYDKARILGAQNNDPNTAIYKTNYERAHAKLKETQRQ
jgi:Flp pilus assembly protein TadD